MWAQLHTPGAQQAQGWDAQCHLMGQRAELLTEARSTVGTADHLLLKQTCTLSTPFLHSLKKNSTSLYEFSLTGKKELGVGFLVACSN